VLKVYDGDTQLLKTQATKWVVAHRWHSSTQEEKYFSIKDILLFVEVYMNKKTLSPWSPLATSIIINGEYEHYKGFRYKVLAIARHSETLEELVVYQALYGEEEIWVRPLTMFLESIKIDGKFQARFKPIK
jgi:hypothetical protein